MVQIMGKKIANRKMFLVYGHKYTTQRKKPTCKALATFTSYNEVEEYARLAITDYDFITYAEIVEYIDFFGNKSTVEGQERFLF